MVTRKIKTQIEIDTGERIKKCRIKRGFNTVEDFAIVFNNGKIHKGFSSYEKGKNIRYYPLFKFCFYLQIEITELLNFKTPVPPPAKIFEKMTDWTAYADANFAIFYNNLKLLRKTAELTQLGSEDLLNMRRENITNYERGSIKPTLVKMDSFAQAYNRKLWELFRKDLAL